MKKTVCLILAVCTLMSYLINASAFYTPVDINNVDFISQSQKAYLYYFQDYAGEDHKWDFSIASISSPTFSKIADRIDIGDVIHTCLRNENLFSMGHDVMTFGYAENNSGDEYLLIFDGWVENGRCILYDSIPVVKAIRVSAEN